MLNETSQVRLFPIMEIFGPVIQGEGIMVGAQTMFVRFGGCDYRCSWCDSLFAVLPVEVKKGRTLMAPEQILEELLRLGPYCRTVTLSGGNPVLHDLYELIELLREYNYQIAVETQGTLFQNWVAECDVVTISPKPPSSGMTFNSTQLDTYFRCVPSTNMCIKVVVFDAADYEFAMSLYENYSKMGECDWYLQPGTTIMETSGHPKVLETYREKIISNTQTIIEMACKDPRASAFRIVPQVHALIYGHIQGV